jgi:hypothetical protein
VTTQPAAPYPGSTLRVSVALVSASETPVNGISVSLVGKERRFRKTRSAGKTRVRVFHRRQIVNLVASYPARTLEPGTLDLLLDFHISPDLPPTYESEYSRIEYALVVHVDVPWWFDANEEFPITVLAAPVGLAPESSNPTRFENTDGPIGKKLYLECSLARSLVAPGGEIEAACSFSNLAFHRVTEISVDLVVIESPLVDSTVGPEVTWSLDGDVILPEADGASHAIRFRVSEPPPAPFHTPFIEVEHFLRIRAKIRFGFDEELFVPLIVAHAAAELPSPARPALVGSAKQAAVWGAGAEVARSLGASVVALEAEHGRLTLDVEGTPVRVEKGRGKDGEPRLNGTVDYPDLGIGLELSSRVWSNRGPGLAPQAKDKLFANGREPEQVAQMLDPAVIEWLLLFDQVAMSDAEALVSSRGSPHKVRDVRLFVERLVLGARTLLQARAALPPPRGFSDDQVNTYRSFAKTLGTELCTGDMSIRGGVERGLVIDLEHTLEAKGPTGSRWVFRAPGHDLSGVALPEASSARFERGAVSISASVPLDPQRTYDELTPLRDTLARWIGRDVGPYR